MLFDKNLLMNGQLIKRKCWHSHIYLYCKGLTIYTSEDFPKESFWFPYSNDLLAKDWQVWDGQEWQDNIHSSGEPKTDLNSN